MKVYNYISMILLAGTAIFASCTQGEEPDGGKMDSLNGFQISVSDNGFQDLDAPQTRATESGYTTKFANGDAIGVFAVKGTSVVSDISNRKFTINDGVWELDGKAIEYKSSEFRGMKFYAYYPFDENVTFEADKKDPFETYVSNWIVGDDQSGENYTKYDLMTSVGDAQGERLKGLITFTMEHRMALTVIEKPQIVYDFTNEGIDDYILKTDFTSFTLGGKTATPYYQESTDTYRFLVNPGIEYSIKSVYTGVKEMECEAKGTQNGGTAQLYKINDPNKYIQELAVGDYYCADGSIVSKNAGTIPDNAIGVVFYVGNPQPSVTHTENYEEIRDALRRDYPNCKHGLVLAINNSNEDRIRFGEDKKIYSSFMSSDETALYVSPSAGKDDTVIPGFMGYNNTILMEMAVQNSLEGAVQNAITYLKQYREIVAVPLVATPWFLGSTEELKAAKVVFADINNSIKKVGGTELVSSDISGIAVGNKDGDTTFYWTSTERNTDWVWCNSMGTANGDSSGSGRASRKDGSKGWFRLSLAF